MKKLFTILPLACLLFCLPCFADEPTTFGGSGYFGDTPSNPEAYEKAMQQEKELADKYGVVIPGVNDSETIPSTENSAFTTTEVQLDSIVEDSDIKIIVNGNPCEIDVPTIIVNDSTLVPIRVIANGMSANIVWDATDETITITKGINFTLVLKINSKDMYVNYAKKYLTTPPIIYKDRTFVPIRSVSEAFAASVEWDESTKTIYVNNRVDLDEGIPLKPDVELDELVLAQGETCTFYAYDPSYSPRKVVLFRGSNNVATGRYGTTDDPAYTVVEITASETRTGTAYFKLAYEGESLASGTDNVHNITVKVVKIDSKEYKKELLRRQEEENL